MRIVQPVPYQKTEQMDPTILCDVDHWIVVFGFRVQQEISYPFRVDVEPTGSSLHTLTW